MTMYPPARRNINMFPNGVLSKSGMVLFYKVCIPISSASDILPMPSVSPELAARRFEKRSALSED